MQLLILAVLIAQYPPQAPQFPPQAPSPFPAYSPEAVRLERRPVATFVGCEPREVRGMATYQIDALQGVPSGSIIVTLGREWIATLPGNAIDLEIRRAARLDQAPPQFVPQQMSMSSGGGACRT